jgi:hypothetical protein
LASHTAAGEVFVVLTASGKHPELLSSVKDAVGAGFTQMVFVTVSDPHISFPIFNVIVYVPAVVNVTFKDEAPEFQLVMFVSPKSFPMLPVVVHPVAGDIDQTCFPPVQADEPSAALYAALELVNVTAVFTHAMFLEAVSEGTGFCETVIGTTVAAEVKHGFFATMLA